MFFIMEIITFDLQLLNYKKDMITKVMDGKNYLWDALRKKYVKADPEEWVRQLLLKHLLEKGKYPQGRLSVEKEFQINNLSKRFDIVANSALGNPICLVECKAPHVRLGTRVLDQTMRYNTELHAPYIILSNGIETAMAKVNFSEKSYLWADNIIPYDIL